MSTIIKPAPVFSGGGGAPALATIYASHYDRLMSVVAAARSGDARLVALALGELDKWGSDDEPPRGSPPSIKVELKGAAVNLKELADELARQIRDGGDPSLVAAIRRA